MKTIAAFTSGRDNNFNLIRFLAAWLVIVAHSYTLNGDYWSDLTFFKVVRIDPGAFAVDVFFITSGFLIGMSFLRQNNPLYYMGARIVRIYPGLVVAVLFCAFAIGPLFTAIPLNEYFRDSVLYEFIFINGLLVVDITQLRYALPSVFLDNPFSAAVNGSLWTLPYEIWMYVLLMLIGIFGLLRSRKWFNLFYAIFIIEYFVTVQYFGDSRIVQQFAEYQRFASLFLTGTFYYVNRDSIPMNLYTFPLNILLILILGGTIFRPLVQLLCLAYGVLWVAFIPGGLIRNFNKLGDYSYGLYIYAFPVQQGLIATLPEISPERLLLISTLITLLFAILSWHLVEKPALSRKDFLHKMVDGLTKRNSTFRRFFARDRE